MVPPSFPPRHPSRSGTCSGPTSGAGTSAGDTAAGGKNHIPDKLSPIITTNPTCTAGTGNTPSATGTRTTAATGDTPSGDHETDIQDELRPIITYN